MIKRYKGLGEEVQFMTLRSNACNLHEKVGEQFLVAAYFDRTDSVFMAYSNCTGTFRINNEKAKNKLVVFRKMTAQNGQLPIDLDNRYIKDQKQVLFNSAYYNFVLRDDDGIPIPFYEQDPTSTDQSRTYSTGNLILYISLAVSILFNALLFLKLRRQEKTHHD